MPIYYYKAVTEHGTIVANKVEQPSKMVLLKKLKSNNLIPISIVQTAYNSKQKKSNKKNVTNIQEIMKNVNTTEIGRNRAKIQSAKEKINLYLAKTEKITSRDLVIFTQNFYLLKKANFNNIHALSTIIQSTENLSFKGISRA